MLTIRNLIYSLFLTVPSLAFSAACNVGPSCGGSDVRVDVTKECMCYSGKCFKIMIGANGPLRTTNGTGTIRPFRGSGIYKTLSSSSDKYNNDALMMGIGPNDARQKWIHKPRNCSEKTRGCIGVPCSEWVAFKKHVTSSPSKEISVCGGSDTGAESDKYRDNPPSGTLSTTRPRSRPESGVTDSLRPVARPVTRPVSRPAVTRPRSRPATRVSSKTTQQLVNIAVSRAGQNPESSTISDSID